MSVQGWHRTLSPFLVPTVVSVLTEASSEFWEIMFFSALINGYSPTCKPQIKWQNNLAFEECSDMCTGKLASLN